MQIELIKKKIHEIRGTKIMLDHDLAELYQVQTKSLNLAVKRNFSRFPDDFMFQLTQIEWEELVKNQKSHSLRFQIETLKNERGKHRKYLPYAFTEQGLAMLSGVLNSDKAIEVNIGIMRTFVLIRQFAISHKDLSKKLMDLEHRFNVQFTDINDALSYLMKVNSPKDNTKRKRIGFKP